MFYVEDPDKQSWHVIVKTTPRAINEEWDLEMIDVDMYNPRNNADLLSSSDIEDIKWARDDVRGSRSDVRMEIPED